MTKNMKLILWYLRTYFPNLSNGQQRKDPEFDFKKNLIKFMSSVYNMQPGSTYNKDVTSLMASNKEFFKASAVFMEYVD